MSASKDKQVSRHLGATLPGVPTTWRFSSVRPRQAMVPRHLRNRGAWSCQAQWGLPGGRPRLPHQVPRCIGGARATT
eukprot:12896779-Prorocentrum_lima.AAC.1